MNVKKKNDDEKFIKIRVYGESVGLLRIFL